MSMLGDVISVLSALGLLGTIQFVGISIASIFLYRYFTDR